MRLNRLPIIGRLFRGPTAADVTDAFRNHRRPIRGRYDAATDSSENKNIWSAADCYDADAANSLGVRQKLVKRSRYDGENNGYAKGINLSMANYTAGRGPSIRLTTEDKTFNRTVKKAWNAWSKRVRLARELRTAVKARVRDGESFFIVRTNPKLRDPVQLDLVGIECDQISTPGLYARESNRIDGIDFDEFGNPEFYYLLPYHPGSSWSFFNNEAERIAARFVLHLYREDRHGQHRGVPETTATLNLSAFARRYREAVVASAETAADFSLFLQMGTPLDSGAQAALPFSTMPIEKRMAVATPAGATAYQLKAEQPTTTHGEFCDSLLSEQARPQNMPLNIAKCDSANLSFSGGQLDHINFFVGVDVDQADIEDCVLDPLFELWYEEAAKIYGWVSPEDETPAHTWDWSGRPQIDAVKTASARRETLGFGGTSLRRVASEEGYEFEEEITAMAEDYGVTVEEMRRKLFESVFAARSSGDPSAAARDATETGEDSPGEDGETKPRRNGRSNGRVPAFSRR